MAIMRVRAVHKDEPVGWEDPNPVLEAFSSGSDWAGVGPLSLVAGFDIELAEFVQSVAAAPQAKVASLLARLEAAGLLSSVAASRSDQSGSGQGQWRPELRAAVAAAFRQRSPERARAVDVALAEWFVAHDAPGDALAHAMAAQAWPTAVDVIEAFWRPLAFNHLAELMASLRTIPVNEMHERPLALAVRAFLTSAPNASYPAAPAMAEEELARVADSPEARRSLDTTLALEVLYNAKGRYREASVYSRQMVALGRLALAAGTPGTAGLMSLVMVHSAILHIFLGEGDAAIADLRDAYRLAPLAEHGFAVGDASGKLAMLYALRGEAAEAAHWVDIEARAPTVQGHSSTWSDQMP